LWRCQAQSSGKESLFEVGGVVQQVFCHGEVDEIGVGMPKRKKESKQKEGEMQE
jgi:hypothetical protein